MIKQMKFDFYLIKRKTNKEMNNENLSEPSLLVVALLQQLDQVLPIVVFRQDLLLEVV